MILFIPLSSFINYKMLKNILTFFVVFIMFFTTKSNAFDLVFNDEAKTIRELKENIEWLDKEKNDLYLKLKDFAPDQTLTWFFRDDLSLEELQKLKSIVETYNQNKKSLEAELYEKSKNLLDTSDIRVKLLEEKKELYKKMTTYIKVEYYQSYLEYIKSDTVIYSERKVIDSDIYRKQEIINNKVNVLEEKIREHKSYLEDSLKKLVEQTMDEKITFLSKNKSFSALENKEKILILDKTIFKISNNIESLKNQNLLNDISAFVKVNNDKKIEIYNIVLKKLETFKNTFK